MLKVALPLKLVPLPPLLRRPLEAVWVIWPLLLVLLLVQ